MLQTAAPIENLPDALQVLKEMQAGVVDIFGIILSSREIASITRIIHDAPVFGRIQPAGGGLGFTRQ